MNQRQWFHGQLEGQYVGHPQPASDQAMSISGEHYRIEITRSVINAIDLVAKTCDPPTVTPDDESDESATSLDDSPTAAPSLEVDYHHEAQGSVFHQHVIPQAFFLEAMGPGKTVRGAAYDVLLSDLNFSHPAKKDGKSYGRICGRVSGWFRPLPEPEPAVEVAPPERPGEVWRTEVLDAPASHAPQHASPAPAAPVGSAGSSLSSPPASIEALDAESDLEGVTEIRLHATADWPFFTIGTLLAVALFLVSGGAAAALWYAFFLPALGLRRWLYEVVPDGWFVRAFALGLMTAQLLTAALLIASWQDSGCKSLGPFSLIFLGGSLFISCLLPRVPSFAVAAACLAAVLGQYFGPLSEFCR